MRIAVILQFKRVRMDGCSLLQPSAWFVYIRAGELGYETLALGTIAGHLRKYP